MRIPKNSDWVRIKNKKVNLLKVKRNQALLSWGKVYKLFLKQEIDIKEFAREMKTFNQLDTKILTHPELTMKQIEEIFEKR